MITGPVQLDRFGLCKAIVMMDMAHSRALAQDTHIVMTLREAGPSFVLLNDAALKRREMAMDEAGML